MMNVFQKTILLISAVLCTTSACTEKDMDQKRQALVNEIRLESNRDGLPPISEAVLDAMMRVPRHEFVPEQEKAYSYANRPLPIGAGQTISQPLIVALMTELAEVSADEVVLEIGTGSGYQAAVLGELAKHVYTIEIIDTLGHTATQTLERLDYDNVSVRIGDGYAGWPEHAPFDAIIVTAAPEQVPQPLIDQLKPGGRMVIPVGGKHKVQTLKVLIKEKDGQLSTRNVIPVRFVPFTREQ